MIIFLGKSKHEKIFRLIIISANTHSIKKDLNIFESQVIYMNTKELALIVIAIIMAGCIIGGCIYAGLASNDSSDNNTIANNTTNVTNKNATNNTDSSTIASQDKETTQKQSSNNQEEYTYSPQSDSYVKNSGEDYDTGTVDENGEEIYAHRWVDDGVVYESYKSSSGREISAEEYYN